MPDQPSGQPPTGNTDSEPLSPTPFEAAIEQRIMALESKHGAKDKKSEADKVLSGVRRGEWWLIGINGLLLIVTVVIACIYNGQLTQMKVATTASTKATRASQQAAYASCIGTQVSRAALLQAIQAGTDAHDSATASTYQTIIATKAESANVIPNVDGIIFQVGQPMGVTFRIRNEGKSPAKHVITKIRVMFVEREDNPTAQYPLIRSYRTETPELIEQTDVSSLKDAPAVVKKPDSTPQIATAEDVSRFALGKSQMLAFVRVTYRDSLGVPHWINFCRTIPPVYTQPGEAPVHGNCIRYNANDENTVFRQSEAKHASLDPIPEISCPVPSRD